MAQQVLINKTETFFKNWTEYLKKTSANLTSQQTLASLESANRVDYMAEINKADIALANRTSRIDRTRQSESLF